MDAVAFCVAMFGLIAFVRVEKLIKELKEKKILDKNYKHE
tara:strand:+ start:375 stop:494 length:120 start_codon:yes stop_codon:yes gene_type:complete